MGERQMNVDELVFSDLKAGIAWGESITKQRAAELEAKLQAWETADDHGKRRGPFDLYGDMDEEEDEDDWEEKSESARLTGADVFWVVARTKAGSSNIEMIVAAASAIRSEPVIVHLEGANLGWAHLEDAWLFGAHLEGAYLVQAHLGRACLDVAHLEGAFLDNAHLEKAALYGAWLEGASLDNADLERASLNMAHLEGASFDGANLAGAGLFRSHLAGATFRAARLEGTNLYESHLEGKRLPPEYAARIRAWMPPFRFFPDKLPPADIRLAVFDMFTSLNGVVLGTAEYGAISLADVRWGGVNLAVVDWTQTKRGFLSGRRIEAVELGDVHEANMPTNREGKPKSDYEWISGFKDAVRANRQLATVLRSQGLNEDADRFAYNAQKLQRQVLRRQRRYGAAIGSWLLDVVAGYGYKPMRTLTVYLVAIISFAIAYFALGQTVGPHLSPLGAFVFSMTSFHGRGFFPGGIVLDDPITVLAAFEAFIGLVIEVSFIATFTQRFFAR